MEKPPYTQLVTENTRMSLQLRHMERDLDEVKKERDHFREDLSQNRVQVSGLTSLVEVRTSKIRDLERKLDRIYVQVCVYDSIDPLLLILIFLVFRNLQKKTRPTCLWR